LSTPASRLSSDVFINLPFDARHERLFIALIAGLVSLGLNPRSVLEIETQHDRLRRLYTVISECSFSLHDMCRVQLSDAGAFRVPRFNMPFELGLAVGVALSGRSKRQHQWRTLEQRRHRIAATLSDIAGYDTAIHGGTIDGMLEALLDIFARLPSPPLAELEDLRWVYRALQKYRRRLGTDVFRPRAFASLVATAKLLVDQRTGALWGSVTSR